jgi:hypothetical protein
VGLGGRRGDDEPGGDVVVGQALGDQRDDLALRSVSESSTETPGAGLLRAANSAISWRVTPGDSSASSLATSRTPRSSPAGSVPLTRKPLARARSASKT